MVALITFSFLALIVFVYAIHYVSQSCGGIDAVKRKDRFLFMASWLNSFWMSFFYLWLILQPWPEVQISAGLHWIIFSIFAVEKPQTLHLCFHLNIQDNNGKRDLSHSKKKPYWISFKICTNDIYVSCIYPFERTSIQYLTFDFIIFMVSMSEKINAFYYIKVL